MTLDRSDRKTIVEACYALGIGTPAFYSDFVGVAFNPDGTPVLLALTWKKVPKKLREKLAGRRIKIVELNKSSTWVTIY